MRGCERQEKSANYVIGKRDGFEEISLVSGFPRLVIGSHRKLRAVNHSPPTVKEGIDSIAYQKVDVESMFVERLNA